jgi:hypothetical protein
VQNAVSRNRSSERQRAIRRRRERERDRHHRDGHGGDEQRSDNGSGDGEQGTDGGAQEVFRFLSVCAGASIVAVLGLWADPLITATRGPTIKPFWRSATVELAILKVGWSIMGTSCVERQACYGFARR